MILFLYFITSLLAIDPANLSQNEIYQANLLKISQDHRVDFESISPDDYFKNAIANYQSAEFPIPEFLIKDIKFWFYIYALFDKKYTVFHHKNNLEIIYDIVDYGDLSESKFNTTIKELIREELLKTKLNLIKNNLKKKTIDELVKLYPALSYVKKFPAKKRRSHLHYLSESIRYQDGLKDEVVKAIKRSDPYISNIFDIFNNFKLPAQIIAIPFVESSFNKDATSKVGAKGVWQIMPNIAKKILPPSKIDYRLDPLIATIAATQLLYQSYTITKSWPLAIMAYHSGLKGILKRTRKNGSLTLERYLRSIDPNNAFATRNYLSEFFAMNLVLNNLKVLNLAEIYRLEIAKRNYRPANYMIIIDI
jgi:membrane-bound lytic murein transglycosylase D